MARTFARSTRRTTCRCWCSTVTRCSPRARRFSSTSPTASRSRGLAPAAGSMERYRVQEWLNFVATELHKGFGPLFRPGVPEDFKATRASGSRAGCPTSADQLIGRDFLVGPGLHDCRCLSVCRARLDPRGRHRPRALAGAAGLSRAHRRATGGAGGAGGGGAAAPEPGLTRRPPTIPRMSTTLPEPPPNCAPTWSACVACSPFAADVLERYPQLLAELVDAGRLLRASRPGEIGGLIGACAPDRDRRGRVPAAAAHLPAPRAGARHLARRRRPRHRHRVPARSVRSRRRRHQRRPRLGHGVAAPAPRHCRARSPASPAASASSAWASSAATS